MLRIVGAILALGTVLNSLLSVVSIGVWVYLVAAPSVTKATAIKIGTSPLLLSLSAALVIAQSISILDVRIIQAKRSGVLPPDHPNLPPWVVAFHVLDPIIFVALMLVDWKVGLAVWAVLFLMKVLPVLETLGNVLMAPFKKSLVPYGQD